MFERSKVSKKEICFFTERYASFSLTCWHFFFRDNKFKKISMLNSLAAAELIIHSPQLFFSRWKSFVACSFHAFFSTSKPDNLSANYVRSFKVSQMTSIRPLSASKAKRNSASLILQVIGNVASFECFLLGILKAIVTQTQSYVTRRGLPCTYNFW